MSWIGPHAFRDPKSADVRTSAGGLGALRENLTPEKLDKLLDELQKKKLNHRERRGRSGNQLDLGTSIQKIAFLRDLRVPCGEEVAV